MKKWLMLALLSIVLVACSNDEPAKTSSKKDEVKQTTESKLTEENAIQIAENIHSNFADTWINMENVLEVNFNDEHYGVFLPDLHYAQYINRLSSFATDNYVDFDYIQMIKESCFSCDMLPYGLGISSADEPKVTFTSDNSFTIKSHYDASYFSNEMNVTLSYVLEDGDWKIDDEQYETLKEANGFTEDDAVYVEPTVNKKLQTMYDKGLALKDSYNNVDKDGTMNEMSNAKYDIAQQFKAYLKEFDQLILTVDPYYEINQKVWAQILKDSIKHTEDETTGGSGQGTFMIETEIERSIDRMETLYYRYMDYFE